jgi:hypothetical protein
MDQTKTKELFDQWFADLIGEYSYRSEWFYIDVENTNIKTRQNLMKEWLYAAFEQGYKIGMEKVNGNV